MTTCTLRAYPRAPAEVTSSLRLKTLPKAFPIFCPCHLHRQNTLNATTALFTLTTSSSSASIMERGSAVGTISASPSALMQWTLPPCSSQAAKRFLSWRVPDAGSDAFVKRSVQAQQYNAAANSAQLFTNVHVRAELSVGFIFDTTSVRRSANKLTVEGAQYSAVLSSAQNQSPALFCSPLDNQAFPQDSSVQRCIPLARCDGLTSALPSHVLMLGLTTLMPGKHSECTDCGKWIMCSDSSVQHQSAPFHSQHPWHC